MNRRQMMTAATVAALGLPTVARADAPILGADNLPAADPAVTAVAAWRVAQETAAASFERDGDGDDTLTDAALEARAAACEAVATPPAGMAAQLALALDMFGDPRLGGTLCSPDGYDFAAWPGGIEGDLLRNLLVSAQAMAARDGNAA